MINKGCARIVEVNDDEIAAAMRLAFRTTRTVTEGAGAAALAALLQEREAMRASGWAWCCRAATSTRHASARCWPRDAKGVTARATA